MLFLDRLKDGPLELLSIPLFQEVHSRQQPTLGQLFEAEQHVEIRPLKPFLHVIDALIVQAMGVDHAENFTRVLSQALVQTYLFGQMVEHQERPI